MKRIAPATAPLLPWAAHLQGDVTADDVALAELARVARPAVRWWWGMRNYGASSGAYCYLCGDRIAPWSAARGPDTRAVAVILSHRAVHVDALLATAGTDARGRHSRAAAN